jgi:hypothetical protein
MIMHAVQPTDTAHYIGGVFSLQGHDGAIARFRVYFDKRSHRLLVRSASYREQPYHGIQEITADPNGSPLFDGYSMTDYAELGPMTAPVDPVRTRTEEQLRQDILNSLNLQAPSQWTTTVTSTPPNYLVDTSDWHVAIRTANEAEVDAQERQRAQTNEAGVAIGGV